MGRYGLGLLVLALLQANLPAEPGPTTGDDRLNLDNYAPVADRLALFWADNPNGRIHTEIVVDDGTRIVFRAIVYREANDPTPTAVGFAEEIRGSSNVNKFSALENCETSSIGRALSNWKYQASSERPSREEMSKVARMGGPTIMSPRSAAEGPTDAQMRMLKALGSTARPATKREASQLIDELKASAMTEEDPF
jgi:hypothetical protein